MWSKDKGKDNVTKKYISGHDFGHLEDPRVNCDIAFKWLAERIEAAGQDGKDPPPIDLYGISAGAIQVLEVARRLQQVYPKARIQFMALLDPVAQSFKFVKGAKETIRTTNVGMGVAAFFQGGRLPETIPANVKAVFLARRRKDGGVMETMTASSLLFGNPFVGYFTTSEGRDQTIYPPHGLNSDSLDKTAGAPGFENYKRYENLTHEELSHDDNGTVQADVIKRAKAAGANF